MTCGSQFSPPYVFWGTEVRLSGLQEESLPTEPFLLDFGGAYVSDPSQ